MRITFRDELTNTYQAGIGLFRSADGCKAIIVTISGNNENRGKIIEVVQENENGVPVFSKLVERMPSDEDETWVPLTPVRPDD